MVADGTTKAITNAATIPNPVVAKTTRIDPRSSVGAGMRRARETTPISGAKAQT
jgi:hypothetical protein